MVHEISLASLRKIIRLARFADAGDEAERTYWPLFKERFPNCERFWQVFVVPTSKRLELTPGEPGFQNRRDGVSEDFWTIALRHYSLFLQFIYASWHLRLTAPSSFADFYSHLGTACDLAEDILLSSYLMILDFKGMQSPILQGLSKEEFVRIAGDYYDKHYSKMYDNYHSKGRNSPLHFPPRLDMIKEYLGESPTYLNYTKYAALLRGYRNVVVHDHLIGMVHTPLGSPLVPRKEKIGNYRRFYAIERAASNVEKLNSDFILQQEQMIGDFAELQHRLNDLWSKPIEDVQGLLLKERNPKLLAKLNLTLRSPAQKRRGSDVRV
jgi:hypothetical protein